MSFLAQHAHWFQRWNRNWLKCFPFLFFHASAAALLPSQQKVRYHDINTVFHTVHTVYRNAVIPILYVGVMSHKVSCPWHSYVPKLSWYETRKHHDNQIPAPLKCFSGDCWWQAQNTAFLCGIIGKMCYFLPWHTKSPFLFVWDMQLCSLCPPESTFKDLNTF